MTTSRPAGCSDPLGGATQDDSAALHSSAVAVLSAWQAPDAEQDALRDRYLAHLGRHPDGLSRHCHPDHLTASMAVLSADRAQVLLNLHRTYAIWMQFGGHCEPSDPTLARAALREAIEETGVAGLELIDDAPLQLDVHEVRCGPLGPAHHLDVRYAAVALPGEPAVASSESLEVRWFDATALPADLESSVRTLVDAARSAG